MNPSADCADGDWQDGCGIRVYYDGQLEPQRFGADLRVTLPEEYRHEVHVVTSDNDFDEDYLNRGNVCISNLNGSVDVDLEQGLAFVILDSQTRPGPTCTDEEIAECDSWPDGAWHQDCPCKEFGAARVETAASAAASITFDIPSDLWGVFKLDNKGGNQSPTCSATVNLPDSDVDLDPHDNDWELSGTANRPSSEATPGAGFIIGGTSEDCADVLYTEDPEGYAGDGKSEEQSLETRGNLTLCSGCARGKSCDQLLAGG
jgi:hypothetical protein